MEEPSDKPTGKITYNLEMAKAVRKIKKPYKNLVVDIMARPNYIAVVIYEDQVMEFEVDQRVNIMEYLMMVRDVIQSYNVRCELEGAKGRVRKF